MNRTSSFSRRRSALVRSGAVAAAAAMLASAAVSVSGALTPSPSTPGTVEPSERSAFDNGAGYVDRPTVALPDTTKPRKAVPRPSAPQPLIAASGTCLRALDLVRDVMNVVPSGLALDKKWTVVLQVRMAQQQNGVCDQATQAAFYQQELAPWLTYQVPKGYRLPEAPQH